MDLSKIGKCELCVLAKQVRARKIEIGEKAIATGTWNQELMDEYEECATDLEKLRDHIHRHESCEHLPVRTMDDAVAVKGVCDARDKAMVDHFKEVHREIIRHGMRLIGVSYDPAGSDSDSR